MQQIQPELPEFAPTRDALAKLLATTQAAAAAYLCTLSATQFERVVRAATAEVAEDVRGLLMRLALAENLAEHAVASPAVAQQLADRVAVLASEARDTIAALTAPAAPVPAETAPAAAAGATDSTSEQDAHAAAQADPPVADPPVDDARGVPIVAEASTDIELVEPPPGE